MKLKVIVCFMAFLLVSMVCRAQSVKHDERGLWNVWLAGTNSAFVAADVVDACKEFKTRNPKDSLVVVVTGFEAWNHLKTGNTAEAVKLFNLMLVNKGTATGVRYAGDRMARSWLTRLDRERVVPALKKIYMRDIEFPASLDALKTLKRMAVPPLTDRWNKPWAYSLDSTIKGMQGQRYVLESSVLGSRSYLKKALDVSYADEINLKPFRMVKKLANAVEFRTSTGKSIVRRAGDKSNRINLVYLGSNIIVLSDGNHWCVMAKPR